MDGLPAAQPLLVGLAADPSAPLVADVVGPAGTGKTVTLRAIATLWTDAGADPDGPFPLLVDDAHLLPDAAVDRLRERAAEPGARMVVARRPWPRDAARAALGAALTATRAPVLLGPLDPAAVTARLTALLGARPAPALAEHVHTRTAGVPSLVDRMTRELAAKVGPALTGPTAPRVPAPVGLLDQIAHHLWALDARVAELVVAAALGAPLDAEVLVPLLGLFDAGGAGVDEVDELVAQARSASVLTPAGGPPPLVTAAVLRHVPEARRLEIRRALAEIELDRGGSVLTVARGLLDTGATGGRVAEVFAAAADEEARAGADAGPFLAAAVAAGAPPLTLAARRAEASLRTGALDAALHHADEVLTAADRVELDDAVRAGSVAAAVLAHRGLLARSADLYRWLADLGSGGPVAVPALVGTGAIAEARRQDRVAPEPEPPRDSPRAVADAVVRTLAARPPTLLAGAEELVAEGVLDSVSGNPTRAVSRLTRAAALLESAPRAALLPDTPAALAALVAVQTGEVGVARSVLERAVAVELGGPAATTRHRLLLGWIALHRGAFGTARAHLAETAQGPALEPRDELLAAALDVALARREGDLAALVPAWARAREAIVRHPVDLYVLQPLGELAIAATRLREPAWVRPHLDEAADLLARLGSPALWSAPLHWALLHAAILAEDRDAAVTHADALRGAAHGSRFAEAMATAAPHWVALTDGRVDPEGVEEAARGLHTVGLSWDGSKLAGQAAIRTGDRRAMQALLTCARQLHGGTPKPTPTPTAEPEPEETGDLSEREREVAALVLEGLTYKQIGERLFISAKTVEHHVARMRQRLGASSRTELFTHLRRHLTP
ncbi:helix-turn-helix transcriptional regulator [Pseudonocardia sp. WMMC193]|uniref:helix-turn-helix transcriptional regulator n=1 Tax=Pseudonocardia sp. WMMC193 TaxID=2911965 RepID=UPI001F005823|nr:helix-turn-helix transcriptional regulator [Pseudonocardia sp. WMMC193]MCF7552028.1 LuxR C-terminal-related transcriptional regulator [Pseudonocardia sp. WMMC193]